MSLSPGLPALYAPFILVSIACAPSFTLPSSSCFMLTTKRLLRLCPTPGTQVVNFSKAIGTKEQLCNASMKPLRNGLTPKHKHCLAQFSVSDTAARCLFDGGIEVSYCEWFSCLGCNQLENAKERE